MNFSIGIIAGLIAMVCWGIGDFLQAIVIKRIGAVKNMFFSNIIGLVLTLLLFLPFLAQGKIIFNTLSLLLLFLACSVDVFAVYNFMRSFEEGEIAIVTPISGCFSLVTVVLAFVFLGERLALLQVAAIFIIILGIFLTSADFKKLSEIHTTKGAKEALAAMFLWGVYFVILVLAKKPILPGDRLSIAATIFFFTSIINAVLMSVFAAAKKGIPTQKEAKANLWVIIAMFGLFTMAWAAYNYGFVSDLVSVVTPVASLSPAVTVLLAVIFFKEKLVLNQKLGIFTILVGLFLISV